MALLPAPVVTSEGGAGAVPDVRLAYLRCPTASIAVDLTGGSARVVHWGRDLGPLAGIDEEALLLTSGPAVLNGAPVAPRLFSLVPGEADGWSGTPGIAVSRGGHALSPRLRLESAAVRSEGDDGGALTVRFVDLDHDLEVTSSLELSPEGVLEARVVVASSDDRQGVLGIESALVLLPLPARADELVDFTGKWIHERAVQRRRVGDGTHLRRVRRGKPGVDSPYVFLAGTPGFAFRTGEVWGMHVAWSGDQQWLLERLPEGAGALTSVLGGGELVRAGEVTVPAGESYSTPRVLFTWSDAGTDGISRQLHRRLRARPLHPRSPRPLVLNTWEAVYFDHDLDALLRLTDRAAHVGVERLVLDDGWFRGRSDDTAGLGDWTVDRAKWPRGLHPLVDRVRAHGMQFGLWVEPEMINPDSDLARDHPDWLLTPRGEPSWTARHQYVLDIARPAAWHHLLERLDALVTEYRIDFLKWDHNRDVAEAARRTPDGDRLGTRQQTLSLYALLDELKARHPGLEIESCAGGGGRIDLEILEHTDRVWASDCNDPVERQRIQQWTTVLIPPELMGSHAGEARAHTTHRVTDRSFRLSTALFAHAGIEWDLTTCSDEDLEALRTWARLYAEFRDLLHSGETVNADLPDDSCRFHGVIDAGATRALFEWVQLRTSPRGQTGRVPLPGVDPAKTYLVRVREDLGAPSRVDLAAPAWYELARGEAVAVPGRVLAGAGLPMPSLNPAQSFLLEVCERTPSSEEGAHAQGHPLRADR